MFQAKAEMQHKNVNTTNESVLAPCQRRESNALAVQPS